MRRPYLSRLSNRPFFRRTRFILNIFSVSGLLIAAPSSTTTTGITMAFIRNQVMARNSKVMSAQAYIKK